MGPILAEEAVPLTTVLAALIDQGLSHGHGPRGYFVSMGTLARLRSEELTSLASALSQLPNPVLWKLDPAHLPGMLNFIKKACLAF